MPAQISLQDLVTALDFQSDEATSYLNPETGEILVITDEEQHLLEHGDSEEDLPEWQRELLPKLREAADSDLWLALPDRFDIHEWSIMERFSSSIENENHREELLDAIHGTGAFRLFRRTIERLGIRDSWCEFREAEIQRIAKEWLESHGLEYK
jgi:hypothetical protein